jgi:hypothetical protein
MCQLQCLMHGNALRTRFCENIVECTWSLAVASIEANVFCSSFVKNKAACVDYYCSVQRCFYTRRGFLSFKGCIRPRKEGFGDLPPAQGDADLSGIVSACRVIELPRLSMRLGSRPGVFCPTVDTAGTELLGPAATESLRPGEVDSGDNLVQVLLAGDVPAPTSRRQLLVASIRRALTFAA